MQKIKGIKKASGYTQDYPGYSDHRVDLFIDVETAEVWGQYIYGNNTWLQYDNPNIRKLCSTKRHLTMKKIRKLAERKLAEYAIECRLAELYN